LGFSGFFARKLERKEKMFLFLVSLENPRIFLIIIISQQEFSSIRIIKNSKSAFFPSKKEFLKNKKIFFVGNK